MFVVKEGTVHRPSEKVLSDLQPGADVFVVKEGTVHRPSEKVLSNTKNKEQLIMLLANCHVA